MTRAADLLLQGKHEELWQMCCGFLSLDINEFMEIQNRLMLQQLELLNNCAMGEKLFRGHKPETVDEFRRHIPLTTYSDYCPELLDKREDVLPARPSQWVHTSGRSGEYACKWVPLSHEFTRVMSEVAYGCGILSCCKDWGDVSGMVACPKLVYAVAPRPYMSGAMAALLGLQSPSRYMPPLEEAESLSFEDRIKEGFQQALSYGFDFFFGLSLVLVTIGDRFSQASNKAAILPMLLKPRALFRLIRGMIKSKLARRPIMPKDLWSIRGILSGGLDSFVYRDKVKELWGKYPLDLYGGTEGGVIATQTWDYEGMTFVPNLNFLEFIPEEEVIKWQMDRSYKPKTLLLDEVEAGKNYEIVITNFHGGAMTRYRPGDLVRITALRNEKLGINLPQMVFERRIDGLIDFVFIRLTEKTIWQAIESTGIAYEDWIAYKKEGEPVLTLLIELKDDYQASADDISRAIYKQITKSETDAESLIPDDFAVMIDFKVETTLLPSGSFASYIAQRRAEGADLAHLKPPHVNPTDEVLSQLLGEVEEIEVVKTKKVAKSDEISV